MTLSPLRERALAWAAADPDTASADEVRALVARGDDTELSDRFDRQLEFGTAGLRGVLAAGRNRMNRAVVIRTTAGLAQALKAQVPDVASRGVVVGRDGRKLSDVFARDVAEVLTAQGIVVHWLTNLGPTPLVAFAVKQLSAAAGVMVTASHNPPEYNGYKVFWGNGAQIIPPHDGLIAAAIDSVGAAKDVPRLGFQEAQAKGLLRNLGPAIERDYLNGVLGLRLFKKAAPLSIVYTAMHGVGARFTLAALRDAGFSNVSSVKAQELPDGAFPTVSFPNPEEADALKLAFAEAAKTNADLILANDPDADRLAVAARDAQGAMRSLSGNELGVLLGHFCIAQGSNPKALVVTTIVSSRQLKAIAQKRGAQFEETLTGFKWIANRAIDKEREGSTFAFGYEEAIGYCVGRLVWDKDGVGAAMAVADMAAWCASRGTTLWGYLEEIQRETGLFISRGLSFTLPGAEGQRLIRGLMAQLRERSPKRFGDARVEKTVDYAHERPGADVLAYELDSGARVMVRPSGTEPKLKIYLELQETIGASEDLAQARARGQTRLSQLERSVVEVAKQHGLP